MKENKFSIVVPVYNVQDYIIECIDSLLNQTEKNIEIILVDDGSLDSSGEICDKYSNDYANVITIHQSNSGLSRARNVGIRAASGKYIIFVDSDDYIIPETCEVLWNYIEKENPDIICADMINDFGKKQKKFSCTNKVVCSNIYLEEAIKIKRYDVVAVLKIIKREFLIENEIFFIEGYFYEDQEYTLKLLTSVNSKVLRIDFPFYYYRQRADSVTKQHELRKGEDIYNVICAMIDFVEKKDTIAINILPHAKNIVAITIYHFSSIYVQMKKSDRIIIAKLIKKRIKKYAKYTRHLSIRMKIQNRLFIYVPELLTLFIRLMKIVRRSR